VHLEHGVAVLQRVRLAQRRAGQLARLAHRHEAQPHPVGDRRADDEPAGLDADDDVDPAGIPSRHIVDHCRKGFGVGQKWGEVLEQHAGLGEVGDVVDPATHHLVDRRPGRDRHS